MLLQAFDKKLIIKPTQHDLPLFKLRACLHQKPSIWGQGWHKAQQVDEISTDNADTSEKLLVSILSTLKQSLRVSQENQELNLQAVAARI